MDKYLVMSSEGNYNAYLRYFECNYDDLLREIINDPIFRQYLYAQFWCGFEVDSEREKCEQKYADGNRDALIDILKEQLTNKNFRHYFKIVDLQSLKNGLLFDIG